MSERAISPQGRSDLESAVQIDDKVELRAWIRLLTCSTLIEREVRTRLRREFDTTLPRFDLLAQLDRAPHGLSMSELSDRMMVSNGNITGLVGRLAQEGLVTQTSAAGDRRTRLVRLTAKGKGVFDRMTPANEAWIEAMMEQLPREDMARLLALLAKLKRSIEAALGDPGKPGSR
jgi:DNA-binding MarR family transcriptional regulator